MIDYTSFENDDLMVFAQGNGQLEYEQKHVYAGSERIEQFYETLELTPDTLKAIYDWYKDSSETGKKGTYGWENGWGDIITGLLILGFEYYVSNTPVETISVTEDITKSNS